MVKKNQTNTKGRKKAKNMKQKNAQKYFARISIQLPTDCDEKCCIMNDWTY